MFKNESLTYLLIMGCSLLLCLAMLFLIIFKEPVKKVYCYENGVKIEAIEYHNEIYLKKGE